MNTQLTEKEVLNIVAGVAECYNSNSMKKKDFIKYKNDALRALVPNIEELFFIIKKAKERLEVDIRIPIEMIQKGYSLQSFCFDIMFVIRTRKIMKDSQPKSYWEGMPIIKPSCSNRETVISEDDILNLVITLKEKLDVTTFIERC